jgi:hypothetical protein
LKVYREWWGNNRTRPRVMGNRDEIATSVKTSSVQRHTQVVCLFHDLPPIFQWLFSSSSWLMYAQHETIKLPLLRSITTRMKTMFFFRDSILKW